MQNLEQDKELLDALARGLMVIESFDQEQPEMTLSEVARKTDIKPATARRILRTLVALGYARIVNKRYLLTPKILGLGAAYSRSAQLEEAFMPELKRLVGKYGDASSVTILADNEIFYVAHFSEQKGSRVSADAGITYPAYPASMGRVLLAGLNDQELDQYFAQVEFEKRTENTETNPSILRKIIQTTREVGFSSTRDELFYGVTALAVPIVVNRGTVIAAINSSGYSGKVTMDELIDQRLDDLRISADRIADTLLRYPSLRHSIERS
ncbi:MAG: IclR family transcriptional regulator [Hyphomicrobiales bacterium]|nr:MAG: IclR family transcriptional regulator [Hyphomicrobiales bacterium]